MRIKQIIIHSNLSNMKNKFILTGFEIVYANSTVREMTCLGLKGVSKSSIHSVIGVCVCLLCRFVVTFYRSQPLFRIKLFQHNVNGAPDLIRFYFIWSSITHTNYHFNNVNHYLKIECK